MAELEINVCERAKLYVLPESKTPKGTELLSTSLCMSEFDSYLIQLIIK